MFNFYVLLFLFLCSVTVPSRFVGSQALTVHSQLTENSVTSLSSCEVNSAGTYIYCGQTNIKQVAKMDAWPVVFNSLSSVQAYFVRSCALKELKNRLYCIAGGGSNMYGFDAVTLVLAVSVSTSFTFGSSALDPLAALIIVGNFAYASQDVNSPAANRIVRFDIGANPPVYKDSVKLIGITDNYARAMTSSTSTLFIQMDTSPGSFAAVTLALGGFSYVTTKTLTVGEDGAHMDTITSTSSHVYIALPQSGKVVKYTVIGLIRLGSINTAYAGVRAIALSTDGTALISSHYDANRVVVIAINTFIVTDSQTCNQCHNRVVWVNYGSKVLTSNYQQTIYIWGFPTTLTTTATTTPSTTTTSTTTSTTSTTTTTTTTKPSTTTSTTKPSTTTTTTTATTTPTTTSTTTTSASPSSSASSTSVTNTTPTSTTPTSSTTTTSTTTSATTTTTTTTTPTTLAPSSCPGGSLLFLNQELGNIAFSDSLISNCNVVIYNCTATSIRFLGAIAGSNITISKVTLLDSYNNNFTSAPVILFNGSLTNMGNLTFENIEVAERTKYLPASFIHFAAPIYSVNGSITFDTINVPLLSLATATNTSTDFRFIQFSSTLDSIRKIEFRKVNIAISGSGAVSVISCATVRSILVQDCAATISAPIARLVTLLGPSSPSSPNGFRAAQPNNSYSELVLYRNTLGSRAFTSSSSLVEFVNSSSSSSTAFNFTSVVIDNNSVRGSFSMQSRTISSLVVINTTSTHISISNLSLTNNYVRGHSVALVNANASSDSSSLSSPVVSNVIVQPFRVVLEGNRIDASSTEDSKLFVPPSSSPRPLDLCRSEWTIRCNHWSSLIERFFVLSFDPSSGAIRRLCVGSHSSSESRSRQQTLSQSHSHASMSEVRTSSTFSESSVATRSESPSPTPTQSRPRTNGSTSTHTHEATPTKYERTPLPKRAKKDEIIELAPAVTPSTAGFISAANVANVLGGGVVGGGAAMRQAILISMSTCGAVKLEELDIATNPTRLTIGDNEYRWWMGVVAGDGAILGGLIVLGGLTVLMYRRCLCDGGGVGCGNNDSNSYEKQGYLVDDSLQKTAASTSSISSADEELELELTLLSHDASAPGSTVFDLKKPRHRKHRNNYNGSGNNSRNRNGGARDFWSSWIEKIGSIWLIFSSPLVVGSTASLVYSFTNYGAAVNLPLGIVLSTFPFFFPIYVFRRVTKSSDVKHRFGLMLTPTSSEGADEDEFKRYPILHWLFGSYRNVEWRPVHRIKSNRIAESSSDFVNERQLHEGDETDVAEDESQKQEVELLLARWQFLFGYCESMNYLTVEYLCAYFISLLAGIGQNATMELFHCRIIVVIMFALHFPPTLFLWIKRPIFTRFDGFVSTILWTGNFGIALLIVLAFFSVGDEAPLQNSLDGFSTAIGIVSMTAGIIELLKTFLDWFLNRRKNRLTTKVEDKNYTATGNKSEKNHHSNNNSHSAMDAKVTVARESVITLSDLVAEASGPAQRQDFVVDWHDLLPDDARNKKKDVRDVDVDLLLAEFNAAGAPDNDDDDDVDALEMHIDLEALENEHGGQGEEVSVVNLDADDDGHDDDILSQSQNNDRVDVAQQEVDELERLLKQFATSDDIYSVSGTAAASCGNNNNSNNRCLKPVAVARNEEIERRRKDLGSTLGYY